jgi:hypothetical protein
MAFTGQGSASCSPDSIFAAITLTGEVVAWEVDSRKEVWRRGLDLPESSARILPTAMALSSDARWLAIGGGLEDGVVYLLPFRADAPSRAIGRTHHSIAALQFNQDGRTILAASSDGKSLLIEEIDIPYNLEIVDSGAIPNFRKVNSFSLQAPPETFV